jgi:hypothetical protein
MASRKRVSHPPADSLGAVGAVSQRWQFGAASPVVSIANDHTPKNVALNAASTLTPYVVEGLDFPIAIGSAAWDWSNGAAGVMNEVFTPDALQSDTIPTGNGTTAQSPQALFDSGQAFGPNQ